MSTNGKHLGKAFGPALALLLVASTCNAGTIGQNRCVVLDKQLSAITQSADAGTPGTVGDLAEKAHMLCLNGKTAQGLRAYAKALRIMGSQPVFPSEQTSPQPNQRIQS